MTMPTTRPGSTPELVDTDVLLGRVLASQARLERDMAAVRHEHETYTRIAVSAHRDVAEIREELRALRLSSESTSIRVDKASKRMAPAFAALLALAEVVRVFLASR